MVSKSKKIVTDYTSRINEDYILNQYLTSQQQERHT